jgi:hypothetical protein
LTAVRFLQALNTLTKNDISEVKGMKAPPMPVRLVMQTVCMLKGLQPTKVKDTNTGKFVMDWWETSKRMLSDMGFLDSLMTFDKVRRGFERALRASSKAPAWLWNGVASDVANNGVQPAPLARAGQHPP